MYLDRFQHLNIFKRTRVPELSSGVLRMHRNEKITNWPEALRKEILGTLPDNFLQCYPNHRPFYRRLSEFLDLPETRFVVTSGIDEAAKNLLILCCAPGDKYAAVWPGYAMYKVYGEMLRASMTPISYDPHHFMSPEELLATIPEGCKLLFLPNPSQPVENYFSPEDMRHIAQSCAKRDILFAVDEAYHFFGSETAIPLTNEFENVLVLRTFSKAFGSGCLRLGYVVGSEKGLAPFAAFRIAHEANALTYHVGSILLDYYDDFVIQSIAEICEGRNFFREQCLADGLNAWGRFSNFVLAEFDTKETADTVTRWLETNNIFVRGYQQGKLEKTIMVTCGPIDTMRRVSGLIREMIGKGK